VLRLFGLDGEAVQAAEEERRMGGIIMRRQATRGLARL
jgi:hypothetical protein